MNLRKLWRELSLETPKMETMPGVTGYLDCIRPEDMPGVVAWGESNGRPFVAIKVTTTRNFKTSKVKVLVAFQRYRNDNSMWVLCGRGCERIKPLCEGGEVPFPDEAKIRNLLRGDTVIGGDGGALGTEIGYSKAPYRAQGQELW